METRNRITTKIETLKNKINVIAEFYLENGVKSSNSTAEEMANNLIEDFLTNSYQKRCDSSNDEDLATLEALVNKDMDELNLILSTLKNY